VLVIKNVAEKANHSAALGRLLLFLISHSSLNIAATRAAPGGLLTQQPSDSRKT
jgi:hypothetical protein